jgi:hypothetical protein
MDWSHRGGRLFRFVRKKTPDQIAELSLTGLGIAPHDFGDGPWFSFLHGALLE